MAPLPGKIINHEPITTGAKQAHPNKSHFGQRKSNATNSSIAPKSAITNEFFQVSDNKNLSIDEINVRKLKPVSPIVEDRYQKPGIPFGTIAAVFTLAITIPIGFIQFSENKSNPNIDPITTASIPKDETIVIDNVSMTKILRNGTFVVSVHGKIKNQSETKQQASEVIVSLLNKDGQEIQSWRHKTGLSTLLKDQSVRFITSAIDITGKAKSVSVKTSSVNY